MTLNKVQSHILFFPRGILIGCHDDPIFPFFVQCEKISLIQFIGLDGAISAGDLLCQLHAGREQGITILSELTDFDFAFINNGFNIGLDIVRTLNDHPIQIRFCIKICSKLLRIDLINGKLGIGDRGITNKMLLDLAHLINGEGLTVNTGFFIEYKRDLIAGFIRRRHNRCKEQTIHPLQLTAITVDPIRQVVLRFGMHRFNGVIISKRHAIDKYRGFRIHQNSHTDLPGIKKLQFINLPLGSGRQRPPGDLFISAKYYISPNIFLIRLEFPEGKCVILTLAGHIRGERRAAFKGRILQSGHFIKHFPVGLCKKLTKDSVSIRAGLFILRGFIRWRTPFCRGDTDRNHGHTHAAEHDPGPGIAEKGLFHAQPPFSGRTMKKVGILRGFS